MVSNILLSVIVPIYNSEDTIEECILSILIQSYANFELILVNDGSDDNTDGILSAYESKDGRIKIINQDNQGVSSARNAGLNIASGELVTFIDSDDTIDREFFSAIIDKYYKNNHDVIFVGYNFINKNGYAKKNYPRIKYNDIKLFENDVVGLVNNRLFLSSCSKSYKLRIIKDNGIYFNKDIKNGEDLIFNMEYFSNINSYGSVNLCYYNYILRDKESLSQKPDIKRIQNNAIIIDRAFIFCNNLNIFNGSLGIFSKYYFKSQMYAVDLIVFSSMYNKKQKIDAINYLLSLRQTDRICLEKITDYFDIEWIIYKLLFSLKSYKVLYLLSNLRILLKRVVR